MKPWTQRTGAQLAGFCSQNLSPKMAVLLGQIVMIIEFPYYIYIYIYVFSRFNMFQPSGCGVTLCSNLSLAPEEMNRGDDSSVLPWKGRVAWFIEEQG